MSNKLKVNKMGVRWKHFKTVYKHRKIVRQECRACGIWWRGLVHDLSKYSITEFSESAKYFQGNKSPIEASKDANGGYSRAWLHHKGHNPHHWEYWIDFDSNGNVVPLKIPSDYVIEMVCDWIGAGKVYSKEKWTNAEPMKYFIKVRGGRHFHPDTEWLIVKLLEIIADKGLEEFHKVCRDRYPLFTDYEGIYIP